jgi:hypothetical protein
VGSGSVQLAAVSASTLPVRVRASAAFTLRILQQPGGAQGGVPLLQQPILVVEDSQGNRLEEGQITAEVSEHGGK